MITRQLATAARQPRLPWVVCCGLRFARPVTHTRFACSFSMNSPRVVPNRSAFALIALLTLAAGLGALCPAAAAVRTPSILGSDMVLQRDRMVPVWGWADPGERITVEFAGQAKSAVAAADGRWRISLDPMSASAAPRTLTIRGDRSERPLVYENVLVGEVWILGGQSNMGWPLEKSTGGAEAAAGANHPWLRVFSQSPYQGAADAPAPDVKGGRWSVCRPETAGRISGVGFYFATSLQPLIRVPIALVQTAMGATWIESWIDPPTLRAVPGARPYEDMIAQAEIEVAAGRKSLELSTLGANRFRRPGALYYGKVTPVQPFAIRGVLWYQGEGNASEKLAPHYHELLTALIAGWRRDWGQGDFPFLIVQLPGFDEKRPGANWPLLRDMQLRVAREVSQTGLVVTIDQGERDNIHPAAKQPVGERAARLARALVYGEEIEGTGPQLEGQEVQGATVQLRFRHVGSGLKSGGGELTGFEICGQDRKFVPAHARITGLDTVSVAAPDVPLPVAVRYAWKGFPAGNLLGGDDLPASPGRTDSFGLEAAVPAASPTEKSTP